MFVPLRKRATPQTHALSQLLARTGIEHIFNPSICVNSGQISVAFRGLPAGQTKPFHAFVLTTDLQATQLLSLQNLTDEMGPWIGHPISDPKLFTVGQECWVTFNTGHFERPNSIYIARLGPKLGQPMRVELSQRSEIEKNWGFFEKDGQLHAIYSLNPLVILRETGRSHDTIHFEIALSEDTQPAPSNSDRPQLTIGTQPVALPGSPQHLALIAHRRWYWRSKRIYTGSPVIVDLQTRQVTLGNTPWIHSFFSLLGTKNKHNPNLLSCSYFAGLSALDERALVSYGINDVDFAFADISLAPWRKLCAVQNKGLG